VNRTNLLQLLRSLGLEPSSEPPSPEKLVQLLKILFDDAWRRVEGPIRGDKVTGTERGILRPVLEIRPARLKALRVGYPEQTLAKTIVALMPRSEWFNEFNPASGAGSTRREAADIVHVGRLGKHTILDFFELKEWSSKESPLVAAMEVYNYALLFSLLYKHHVPPYDSWPDGGRDVARVRVWLLAPEAYFAQFTGPREAGYMLRYLEECRRALAKDSHFIGLALLEFAPRPVVLDRSVERPDFLESFDERRINEAMARGGKADSPLILLSEGREEQLRTWIGDAFNGAGFV